MHDLLTANIHTAAVAPHCLSAVRAHARHGHHTLMSTCIATAIAAHITRYTHVSPHTLTTNTAHMHRHTHTSTHTHIQSCDTTANRPRCLAELQCLNLVSQDRTYTDCTPAPKHSVLLYRHRPSNIHSNPPPRCAPGTRPPRAYACCSLSPTSRSSAVRTKIAQAKHPTPHLRRLILTYCVLTYCVPLHAAAAICACSLDCQCSGRALCQTGGGSSAASEPPKKIGAIRFF